MADVMPRPDAAFSPLAMMICGLYLLFSSGRQAFNALRPVLPTISPMNKTLMSITLLRIRCVFLLRLNEKSGRVAATFGL